MFNDKTNKEIAILCANHIFQAIKECEELYDCEIELNFPEEIWINGYYFDFYDILQPDENSEK